MKTKSITFIGLVLATILLSSMMLVGLTVSEFPSDPPGAFSPWADLNDDGRIDIFDLVWMASRYGSAGTPVNKTELLYNVSNTYAGMLTQIAALQGQLDSQNSTISKLQSDLDANASRISELEAELQAIPTLVFATWNVTWRTISSGGEWLEPVGTSQFSPTFDHNWGTAYLFQSYDNYIGFNATMQIKMQRDGPVTFAIGSDDGSELLIDGISRISLGGGGYKTSSITLYLSPGYHELELWYYETVTYARVSFTCDEDMLRWYG